MGGSNPALRRRSRGLRGHRVWFPLLASLAAFPAVAEGPDLLGQPFSLSLGTYILDTDTTLRLDGSSGDTGTEFDWQHVFGQGDVNRFRFDGTWRFAERHKVRGMWFDFSRTRTRTNDFEIEWGDEVYPVGTEITGKNRFSILELAYEYAFLRREDLELAATAGLHYTTFKASLSATVDTPGGGGTREASDTAKLDVPLPVFGVRGLWNFAVDFWLDAALQYFSLSYEDYDGRITDARLALLWQPSDWVGVGLGYNSFDIEVDLTHGDFRGELDWVYDGPMLFYSVSF